MSYRNIVIGVQVRGKHLRTNKEVSIGELLSRVVLMDSLIEQNLKTVALVDLLTLVKLFLYTVVGLVNPSMRTI